MIRIFLLALIFSLFFSPSVLAYEIGENNQKLVGQEHNIKYYSDKLSLSEQQIKELIGYSNSKKVKFAIVFELLRVETGGTFKHNTVGPETRYGRAYGIAQFMMNTAPWIAEMGNIPFNGKEDLFDAYKSIKLAIVYLNYLQYGDGIHHKGYNDWHSTLTAYNRGMHGLNKYKQTKGTTVSVYSENILKKLY